ncbi:hypothetical protein B0O80DRAFT_508898 [Mortierella sp. GBAus27b]|nr:hypothetical protein B0O80DRAFT_508898 [Mortierella sp. GBAus27b]
MSRFSDLAAQKWPRIVISLFAITRLLLDSAIYAIGYDRANPGVSDEYSTIPADEQKRIAQGLILSMAALTTTFNLIAFYSAIRSSIGATKVSLAIWGFQFSSMFMVVWLIMGPVFTSEVARKAIDNWQGRDHRQLGDVAKSASSSKDSEIVLVLCHHAEVALSRVKGPTKKSSPSTSSVEDQSIREGMANAYNELGRLLELQDQRSAAVVFYKKAEKWRYVKPTSDGDASFAAS